jgi:hypothetical protein
MHALRKLDTFAWLEGREYVETLEFEEKGPRD